MPISQSPGWLNDEPICAGERIRSPPDLRLGHALRADASIHSPLEKTGMTTSLNHCHLGHRRCIR